MPNPPDPEIAKQSHHTSRSRPLLWGPCSNSSYLAAPQIPFAHLLIGSIPIGTKPSRRLCLPRGRGGRVGYGKEYGKACSCKQTTPLLGTPQRKQGGKGLLHASLTKWLGHASEDGLFHRTLSVVQPSRGFCQGGRSGKKGVHNVVFVIETQRCSNPSRGKGDGPQQESPNQRTESFGILRREWRRGAPEAGD